MYRSKTDNAKTDNSGDKAISQKNEDSTADTDNEDEETEPGYLPKDFSLTIDDTVYQNFPLSVQEFCDLGWQFDDEVWSIDDSLKGKSYTGVNVINQHNIKAGIEIINEEQGELSLSSCTVSDMRFFIPDPDMDVQDVPAYYSAIYCTDNIVLGESTPDDVLAAYGDPYYRDDNVGVFAYFISDQQCEVEFCFGEQNILIGICIRYDYDYEDYDYDSGIDYDENAGYLPSDFALTIDGYVCQDFPLSVQEFCDLGWQIDDDYWSVDEITLSHSGEYLAVVNQQNTRAGINWANDTEEELPLASCVAYGIHVSVDDTQSETADYSNIYCTGNIVLGKSTLDDVLAAYGEPWSRYDDACGMVGYTELYYESIQQDYDVLFLFNEQNQLVQIFVTYINR